MNLILPDLAHLRVPAQQGFHAGDVGHVLRAPPRLKGCRAGETRQRLGWTRQRLGHQDGHQQVLLEDFRRTSFDHARVDGPVLLLAFLRPPVVVLRPLLRGEAGGVRRPESIPRLLFGCLPGRLCRQVVLRRFPQGPAAPRHGRRARQARQRLQWRKTR